MDTIKLNITREKAMVASAMPYSISLNNKNIGKLKNGQEMSYELPNTQSTLKVSMVGNFFTVHKLEKEVVLFPHYSKTAHITCKINTKINWLGLLTFGLFQAVGKIELNAIYH